MIKFKLHTKEIEHVLVKMGYGIYTDAAFLQSIKEAQKSIIEQSVKNRLISNRTANPAWTDSKNTNVIQKIADMISTGFALNAGGRESAKAIIVGTGNISKMNEEDPIHSLNDPPRSPKEGVALWKIMEFGSEAHKILPRDPKAGLHFFWKKIGKWVGSPQNKIEEESGKGFTNKNVKGVNHPGTEGRHFFFRDNSTVDAERFAYNTDRVILKRIKMELKKYIGKYSAKRK